MLPASYTQGRSIDARRGRFNKGFTIFCVASKRGRVGTFVAHDSLAEAGIGYRGIAGPAARHWRVGNPGFYKEKRSKNHGHKRSAGEGAQPTAVRFIEASPDSR